MRLPSLTANELRDLILSVGTHHRKRKLSPVEVASLFLLAIQNGATLEDCADTVHLNGTSMISRFLRLQQLSPAIQHLIDWGQSGATIGFSSAVELVKLNEDEQEILASKVLEKQLTKTEVQQIVQLRMRSKRGINNCVDEVMGMRPTTEIRHVFIGSILDSELIAYLKKCSQRQRDELLEESLKESCPELNLKSGRLGTTSFTLVTDDVSAKHFKGPEKDKFEQKVNSFLGLRSSKDV